MRLGVSYCLENIVDQILAVDIVLKLPTHPKAAIKVMILDPWVHLCLAQTLKICKKFPIYHRSLTCK